MLQKTYWLLELCCLTAQDSEQQRNLRAKILQLGLPRSQLEPNFTTHEVEEVIRNLDDKKSPGPDGIDGAIVKRLHNNLPTFWISIFNKCLLLGCFPREWKQARVIAIPKPNKPNLKSVQGYRGISLLSIPGKCLEKLVIERLNYFLQSTGQTRPQQYGFTAGKSTADAIKTVIEFVRHSRKIGQKCCLLTLDIAGAFDNAWHPVILDSLQKLKCPPNIYNMVRNFLCDRTAHVVMGNASIYKSVAKGCPQGSVSGPTLWNIIIGDLIAPFSDAPNVKIVVFADDILIMMEGPSSPDILDTLQITLQTVEKWCKERKLEISKDKSALMPMFIRNREQYKQHPILKAWGLQVVSKMKYLGLMLDSKLDWYPHTQYLENKVSIIRNNLARCSRATWGMSSYSLTTVYKYGILPIILYASEAWSTSISKRAKNKLQQIQRSCLIFTTKAYRTVSSEALSAIAGIMPIDQAMHLYKDTRAVSRGQPTNSVLTELKKIEIPTKTKGIHPKDNYIRVDITGTVGNANVDIYTDGSKTSKHVGAGMVVMKDSCEIHIESQKLNSSCTVFQAELYGITMAVDWIHNERKKAPSYTINVHSKSALLSIANKHTTHPLAVAARLKTIELRRHTSVAFHWVKGHAGLEGNERADYLAKTAASYNTTIAYDSTPINQGKKILEDYYTKLWNETYINSTNASHTKPFIPTILHRLSLSLWPNYTLTQFLTNHGSFRSYLHKMNRTSSPICKCPEKAVQTARHLLLECSLFSTERPTALQTLAPHLVLKHHINTISVTSFLKSILHTLQEQD